jgi:hypothetical protein
MLTNPPPWLSLLVHGVGRSPTVIANARSCQWIALHRVSDRAAKMSLGWMPVTPYGRARPVASRNGSCHAPLARLGDVSQGAFVAVGKAASPIILSPIEA